MRTFLEYTQTAGTYVAVYYHPEEVEEKILRPLQGLPGLYDANEIHTTLMYAMHNPFRPLRTALAGQTILLERPRYEILGKDSCLTIAFDSTVLQHRHVQLKQMGLEHSYPTLIPHITVVEGFSGDTKHLPPLTPTILTVSRESVEPIR